MWTRRFGMLALCTLAAGCHLASNCVHNMTYEAKLSTAEFVERCEYEKLARASLESTDNHRAFPREYVHGYKDGFVDYLLFGGSGQPPFVPPKRFWGPHYRTPEGYQSIQDWYAGFRHGVAAAHQSGYRTWSTVPTAHTTEPQPPHDLPAPNLMPPPEPKTSTSTDGPRPSLQLSSF